MVRLHSEARMSLAVELNSCIPSQRLKYSLFKAKYVSGEIEYGGRSWECKRTGAFSKICKRTTFTIVNKLARLSAWLLQSCSGLKCGGRCTVYNKKLIRCTEELSRRSRRFTSQGDDEDLTSAQSNVSRETRKTAPIHPGRAGAHLQSSSWTSSHPDAQTTGADWETVILKWPHRCECECKYGSVTWLSWYEMAAWVWMDGGWMDGCTHIFFVI